MLLLYLKPSQAMSGLYLKCEKCSATFNGLPHHPRGIHWSQSHVIQQEARELGWTGDLTRESTNDLCPACSASISNTPKP